MTTLVIERMRNTDRTMNTRNITRRAHLCILLGCAISVSAQNDTVPGPQECTVLLIDGDKLPVTRFWRIADGLVEYEQDGSLHDLRTTEIQAITCGGRDYVIANDSLLPVLPATTDGQQDFFELGRADAAKHYHGGGAFATGLLTSPMLIVAPIIAAVPPSMNMRDNPNAGLYDTNVQYRLGYRKKAHEKKAGHVFFGMTVGLALLFGLAAQ